MRIVSRKPAEVAPARMGRLAKLPVFLDLKGKRVVVVGGGAAAVWKAELAQAAGALVDLYAETISDDPVGADVVRHARPWTPRDLEGAALAICAARDDAEAAAFHAAARAAGVLANVIDRPKHSDIQFGSIVNRSPVVIGISTDGAAPILAQAIRRRIETLLPPSLAAWAASAKRLRAEVNARLPMPTQRRAFWERLAERAFGPVPEAKDAAALLAVVQSIDAPAAGRVTLVGAGPGDAELLTLKAVRALQAADVILFDDLVSDSVLELARREAKRMLVGKRGRRESCRQEDINALMINLARQGRHVVRLKSGDPMIFGRAGEEIGELREAGVAVTVVPGVTAGLAMAAALGVSLTHRDHAQSVRFVTGHARHGALPDDLDWRGLADPRTTLVFYMGGRTAPTIAERLMEHCLGPDTPAVAVAGISGADERRWVGTLAGLAGSPLLSGAEPVLIGIGTALAGSRAICEERGVRQADDVAALG